MKPVKLLKGIEYIRHHGIGNAINNFRLRSDEIKGSKVSTGFPRTVQIEITTACNLKCLSCRGSDDSLHHDLVEPRNLAFKEFKSILGKLPYVTDLMLHGSGEPLLHKDVFRMIAYASAKNIDVRFHTNCTLLDKKRSEGTLDSGLAGVTFSIDGATKATFELLRKGAIFEEVSENIRNFMMLRDARGSKIKVSTMTTVSRSNLHELSGIVRLAHSWGIKKVKFKKIVGWTDQVREMKVAQLTDRNIIDAAVLAKNLGIQAVVSDRLSNNGVRSKTVRDHERRALCNWPWTAMYITVNGSVTPCCNLFSPDEINFGNILTDDLQEIWNHPDIQELRAGLRTGLPQVCQRPCSDNAHLLAQSNPASN